MKTNNDIFLHDMSVNERTQAFWEAKYGEEISIENARQINARIVKFFRLLHKWSIASITDESDQNQNGKKYVS